MTIFCYTLFRWIVEFELDAVFLKDDLLNFWIPFVLPLIPIFIWMRPRVRILNVRGSRDNGRFGYQLAMSFAIAAPMLFIQNYIDKAPYELIALSSIEEVEKHAGEKYFQLASFSINSTSSFSYFTSRTSGRYNDQLNFYTYTICPFDSVSNIWYGIASNTYLNNNINDQQKNDEYQSFIIRSKKEFKKFNPYSANYFEKLDYSDARDGFIAAIKEAIPQVDQDNQIILIPKNDNFHERLGNTFHWIYGSFLIGSLVIFIMVMLGTINSQAFYAYNLGHKPKEDSLLLIMGILNPFGEYRITAILLLINIVVFLLMALSGINIVSPTPKELLDFGGNSRPETMNHEYWRLLTSLFVHGGLMHLVTNLFGLGLAAVFLENLLGIFWFLTSFIICGVLASLTSVYWYENVVSVGASGAIFGLYGIMFAFALFKLYQEDMEGIVWLVLLLFVGLGLLAEFLSNVDNAAHLGGLFSGFLMGLFFVMTKRLHFSMK